MSDLEAIIQKLVRQELHEQMPGIIARALANDRNARNDAPQDTAAPRAMLAVRQAAELTGRHPVTLRRALEDGELHGHQLRKGGRWTLERQCLLAWIDGDPCLHNHKVSPLRPQPRRR
jgi:excisionase family DNA binding protein